jgi:hypothetical protein
MPMLPVTSCRSISTSCVDEVREADRADDFHLVLKGGEKTFVDHGARRAWRLFAGLPDPELERERRRALDDSEALRKVREWLGVAYGATADEIVRAMADLLGAKPPKTKAP